MTDLRRNAHRLAGAAGTDHRPAERWLRGHAVMPLYAAAFERAARELGIPLPDVATSSRAA